MCHVLSLHDYWRINISRWWRIHSCFPFPGCGARAGGQHSAKATARQRRGSRSDPKRHQTHGHPGAGARPGDHQPPMELTQQTGRNHSEVWSIFLSLFIDSPIAQTTWPDTLSPLPSGGRADRPAAGGPVALWEIPGCSGAAVELAQRHRGAGGQPEASVCRVPRRQGPDPRTKGRRRICGRKLSRPHI